MSAIDRIYGAFKAIILMNERFDRIDKQLNGLSDELTLLAASHANLAQEVAEMRGYFHGRADQAALQARLPEK